MSPELQRATTQEAVLAELRRMIVDGSIKPGARIYTEALASDLGVSRVPVREALKILEGEGQVVYRPHYGYTLSELNIDDLREIYRIRELLEAEAVRCGLPLMTAEELRRMREAMDEMEAIEPSRIADITSTNRRFHFALLETANMPRLLHQIRVLWDASVHYRSVYLNNEGEVAVTKKEHRAIFQATKRKDTEHVIELLNRHRARALLKLSEILVSEAPADTAADAVERELA